MIPAWPALMCRETFRAYLDDLGDATLKAICPVAPVDLGNSVIRYRRSDVDRWIESLPLRQLRRASDDGQDAPAAQPEPAAANDRASAAVARAAARAQRRNV